MQIDPRMVKWDEPVKPNIDARMVKWDEPVRKDSPKSKDGGLLAIVGNTAAGALRGAGSIGATLLAPLDVTSDLIAGKGFTLDSNRQRRADMDAALKMMGADPDSFAFKGGKLGTEIAGTLGVGGALAKPLVSVAPNLAAAISSGGMTAGGGGMATRMAGGAISGGASAALVNPDDATAGAVIGGAMPGVVKVAGLAGSKAAQAYRNATTPEKVKIAQKLAQTIGASKEEVIAALEQQGPEMLDGYRKTVPQIFQTPKLSQLQRTLKTAGVNALGDAERVQQAQMRQALNRVAPVDLTVQDAAARAGGAVQKFGVQARADATDVVRKAFDAVDPFGEARLMLPLQEMRAAQAKFLGPGTFGTGQRAAQAIQAAEDAGTVLLPAVKPSKQIASEGLAKAVRRAGGIKGKSGELRDLGIKQSGTTGLVNNRSGRDLDILAEEMAQRGYIGSADPDELLTALSESVGGRGPRISFDVSDDVLRGMSDAASGEAPGALRVSQAVPFATVQNLRSSIGEAAEQAAAKGANKEAAALRKMVEEIDSRVNKVAAGKTVDGEFFPKDIADQYRKALDLHAQKMQRFETGPQVGMFRKGADGQASIQGAEIPGKFFSGRRSQVEDMQAFKRLIGNREDLAAEMKRYAMTEGVSTSNAQGDLTSKFIDWMESRSGANAELFTKQELATIKEVGKAVDRQIKAESLGRVSGSDTAQKLASLNDYGMLDGRLTDLLANRIPYIGQFTGPMLSGLRQNAATQRNLLLGGLLNNPDEFAAALRYGSKAAPSLLDQSISRALPLTYRAAPVGLLGI